MIELLIFDADGVLFDSYESNIAYYNAIFSQLGEPPLNRQEEIASISYAAGDVFRMRAGHDGGKLALMFDIARDLDATEFFALLRPPFELRPFMLDLKRRYRLGLATNRSATVPRLVEFLNLSGVFDAVASVLDKVRPKPAPDILHLCLERAKVDASRAIYIGDSAIDLEAAETAGIRFLAVGDRVEHPNRIATLDQLQIAIERFGSAR